MISKTTSVAVSILLAMQLITACSSQEAAVHEERAISVRTSVAELSDEQLTRSFTGSVEGERQADIYAKMAEAVEKVHVREGDHVSEGQLLISLDKTGPSSSYNTAESVFRNSEKTYKKMEYLFSEGAISESQYDAARTQFEVNKAAFESASRLVDIQSPIVGVVTSVDVSEGDFLSQGQHLATVATTDRLRVKCAVNSRDIGYLKEGGEVMILSDATDTPQPGRIVGVARSADPKTRAFQLDVLFDNVDSRFRPGMFVRVISAIEELPDVIAVPREAIILLDEQDCLFIVKGDRVRRQPVSLGADLGGRVVVTEGLKPGDTLVTLGQTYLSDGFKVKIASMETVGQ